MRPRGTSSFLYCLTKNPEGLGTLTAEVREAFASDDEANLTDLTSARYLHFCIEETLRLVVPGADGSASSHANGRAVKDPQPPQLALFTPRM